MSSDEVDAIVGADAGLREVMRQVEQVARTESPVLLLGETGSGKDVVARSIHRRSTRADGPILRVNCGAIAPDLIDSELFGHERGSFTGASALRRGWFERADGGTLFLDEIGELPLAAQVRLLRVLQDGTFERVGGQEELRTDVRVIAATHRDLAAMVRLGRFREDLWYRIHVFAIRLPPLRQRRGDIADLAAYFADRAGRRLGAEKLAVTAADLVLLQGYDWPGNVRELQNEIQRLVIQIDPGGFVAPDMLSPRVRQVEGMIERVKPAKGTLKEMMDQLERWLLIEALREHGNNKTAAAKSLGITREGLHKKLRAFGL